MHTGASVGYGTYRLRVPAYRLRYAPEAQGGLPPGPRVQYVLGTRTSHGRTVRTAFPVYHPRYLPAFEDALREVIVQQDPTLGKTVAMHEYRIGVEVG